ncbi:hypothetical protein PFISCL1PPCAC_20419 [Pristionchus fissidentatus]|uniref:Uncharacterized protein n=1 Tax=Pristionchus fissidentatus TaxID=1538716 RepID=A0AAV5WBA5_9BILA|nr:hypothetical protein PFISCL1PPCAC_20419 [Pristionchus fissidentatus]
MTQLHADKQGRRRARLLHRKKLNFMLICIFRSATAERVVAEWARAGALLQQSEGTKEEEKKKESNQWLRSIMRTRSVENMRRMKMEDDSLPLTTSLPSTVALIIPPIPAPLSSRSSSKSKTVYSSTSLSDSSLSDLFSPSESEDSGLSITRRKKLTKKKKSKGRKDEMSVLPSQGKSHLEHWIDQLCVV